MTNALKTTAVVSVTAAATMLLVQACGGGAIAQVDDNDPMVGVWQDTVSVKDCASGAVLASFQGLGIAHKGGTYQGDSSTPPTTRGAAFGTWKRDAANEYTVTLVLMRFAPDLTLAGTTKVVGKRTLSADGNRFTSTLVRRNYDNTGALQLETCASTVAQRVAWW